MKDDTTIVRSEPSEPSRSLGQRSRRRPKPSDNGTPPNTLGRLLEHSTVWITMQFYNRVTDASEDKAARTVNRRCKHAEAVRHAG